MKIEVTDKASKSFIPKKNKKIEELKIKVKSSVNNKVEKENEVEVQTVDWGNFKVSNLVDKIMLYTKTLTGITLHPYQKVFQRRIIESVLLNDGEELTALFSRQSGKTEVVAITAVGLMSILPVLAKIFPKQLGHFKHGLRIGLFAPQSEQAETAHERMYARLNSEEAEEILRDPDLSATARIRNSMVTVEGEGWTSYCRLQSAAKQAKVESKTYDILILDEAQEITELKVTKSIHPMVAATNGTIIKIGTPIPEVCEFYKAIRRNKLRKKNNHFEYDYKTVIKYNKKYKAFLQKEEARLGLENDSFRMAYKLEWLLEKGMALTPANYEEYLRMPSLKFEYGNSTDLHVAGLDLGKAFDKTVLTVLKVSNTYDIDSDIKSKVRDKYLSNLLELSKDDWYFQVEEIKNFLKNYRVKILAVDATGVGDAVVEMIRRALGNSDIKIVGVRFSEQIKSKMTIDFYNEMRSYRIRIPGHQSAEKTLRLKTFYNEWTTVEKVHKGQYSYFRHSEERGAHDDYVDSFLLAILASEELNKVSIDFFSENVFKAKNSHHSFRYREAVKKFRRVKVRKASFSSFEKTLKI